MFTETVFTFDVNRLFLLEFPPNFVEYIFSDVHRIFGNTYY